MLKAVTETPVLALLIDSIGEPLFVYNKSNEILVWNKACVEITGSPSEAVLGKAIQEVFTNCPDKTVNGLLNGSLNKCQLSILNQDFNLTIEPLDEGIYKAHLKKLGHAVLNAIPPEYLAEVINASPISTIIFNLDGSILYSNNAYQRLWQLTDQDINFVNNKYNIFLDKQLEDQGLMNYIREAFAGSVKESPVFEYKFNSSSLGRDKEPDSYKMLAHMYPLHDEMSRVEYVVLSFLDVTEQSYLQDAFKESRERLKLALKGGNLGTWDWNLQTGEMIYNKRWASMLGYKLQEVYNISWKGLLHPDDRQRCLAMMEEFIKGNYTEYESEYRLRSKSGEYIWILDRGQVMERDSKGKPLRGVGTHMDITERKRNQEKVEESEAKYRRLVENSPIGIAIIADEKVQYINKELARLGKVDDPKKVIGTHIKNFIVGDDRYEIFKQRQSLVLDQGESTPLLTTQFENLDGDKIDVEIVSIPIRFEGMDAIQVLINDISERQLAQKELARSQKLLNQLFKNSPMGIVYLDSEFKVQSANLGFERIFGYREDEIKGKSLMDFIVPPELLEEGNQLNQSAFSGNIDYVQSYRIDRDGLKKHLLIYALPVMDTDEHIGVFGIYVDIGQRIEAEEELKIRNLELDNFVYKVSHDLRAPLASILGLINLTKLEGADTDKEYYIDLMEGQVNKLDHFIRDILSHSKNLKMSVAADDVDFDEIVQKCFDDLGFMKASSKVVRQVKIECEHFVSDKWRINEIFRNLIGNAIKYRNQDVEENLVAVSVTNEQNGALIEVRDNGIGIAEEKLPHVLEMFYRGAETSDGSGIGLYIVQKAVEKLGGTIDIDSTPNKGSKFTIWLPSLA